MLENTKAIILQQIKYSDAGIVVHAYTRRFGRQSVLVRGLRKKQSGKHNIMFQPLFVLDLTIYHKESREMQTLKEASVSFSPYSIHSEVMKSSMALFIGEVLSSVLYEEIPNEQLFDFIESSIIYLDEAPGHYSNFHIAFLSGLSSFLGFEPSKQKSQHDIFFDMQNGRFVPAPPLHGNYASEEISDVLAKFFSSSFESAAGIHLNGKMRNETLDTILKYYSLHLPALKRINSLAVLKEVFG
jgi:DNA repair protein RecO (recombination protein O)